MAPSSDPTPDIDTGDWINRERIVQRFETAWRAGSRPAIEDYLPAAAPPPRELLLELVHTDLEYRLKSGEVARVEEYLQRYPGLAGDGPTLLALLQAEYELRRRVEPDLTSAEYRARFPAVAGDWVSKSTTVLGGPQPGPRLACP
jgi:hypothetical protein